MTWQRKRKNATVGLSKVGPSSLPNRGPKDTPIGWLNTLKDKAMNREHLRSRCHLLPRQVV